MIDTLPGYDAWKTRSPYEDEGPEVWAADFECGCGHAFDDEGEVVEYHTYRSSGYQCCEGKAETTCPKCGATVTADFVSEPDWADVAEAQAEARAHRLY